MAAAEAGAAAGLDGMRKRLKEMDDEAASLREMQAKVEQEMGLFKGTDVSNSELGMMENPVLSCDVSSRSSNKIKKTLLSSETNSEEQNQENNVVEFVNHCVGMRMEGRVICTSNGHEEDGGLEVGKEFPKNTNTLECSTYVEPIITPIWSGSFNMSGKKHDILDGLKGHVSSRAYQKVYNTHPHGETNQNTNLEEAFSAEAQRTRRDVNNCQDIRERHPKHTQIVEKR